MNSTPGTVSRILWHFTGGPKWNQRLKKQGKKPKHNEDAYSHLAGILKSKTLRLGGYAETLTVSVPRFRYNQRKRRVFRAGT